MLEKLERRGDKILIKIDGDEYYLLKELCKVDIFKETARFQKFKTLGIQSQLAIIHLILNMIGEEKC